MWFNDILLRKYFSFSPQSHPVSAVFYMLNHATPRHLAFNMMVLWSFGNQLVENPHVRPIHMASLTAFASLLTALSERPWLTTSKPLVGASGVVMAYLASLSVIEPQKTWIMILPIPGVPVTNLQLFQGCVATHIGLLLWNGATNIAIRGHLAGMATGYIFAKLFLPFPNLKLHEISAQNWTRSITSAELTLYWLYLSAKLMIPDPFRSETERGLLRTKRRFIERVWREDF